MCKVFGIRTGSAGKIMKSHAFPITRPVEFGRFIVRIFSYFICIYVFFFLFEFVSIRKKSRGVYTSADVRDLKRRRTDVVEVTV